LELRYENINIIPKVKGTNSTFNHLIYPQTLTRKRKPQILIIVSLFAGKETKILLAIIWIDNNPTETRQINTKTHSLKNTTNYISQTIQQYQNKPQQFSFRNSKQSLKCKTKQNKQRCEV
jgi:hypothetical protein